MACPLACRFRFNPRAPRGARRETGGANCPSINVSIRAPHGDTFPVEGREADRLAGTILDNQIEIIVDDQMGGFKKGKEWIEKVKARTAARGAGTQSSQ